MLNPKHSQPYVTSALAVHAREPAARPQLSKHMHPRIYQEFENIFAPRQFGSSVLDIGMIPSEERLLRRKAKVFD